MNKLNEKSSKVRKDISLKFNNGVLEFFYLSKEFLLELLF